MVQIIDTGNPDEVSAFLTTTFISHSYEVESTSSIVSLWDNIRNNITLQDDMDYISAILATGRIMDYRYEIKDPDIVNTIISDINKNLSGRTITRADFQRELVSAFITAASISRTEEVEHIREIVNLWTIVTEKLPLNDELDLIAGILSIGRIMELKINIKGYQVINDIFISIRSELGQHATANQIGQKELSAAFVTAAYIEVSPKVEKIRDIVETWMQIGETLNVQNHWDYIASILTTGRIRDMNAQHMLAHDDLSMIYQKIREQIKGIVGE